MTDNHQRAVTVVSDLHLFCRRSRVPDHMDALHDAVAASDLCVLNGDIFDFRWTTLDTIEETVDESIRWLDAFISRHAHAEMHYVLGNHDNVSAFTTALDRFATERPALTWHPYYVRLGDAVFLHGDVANWKMDADGLAAYRRGWHDDAKKGKLVNTIYDMAFTLGVHRFVHWLAFPRKAVADRILHYLESVNEGPDTGLNHVYFGHTHLALADHAHGGLLFHNCGAPMPGLKFTIFQTTIDVG
ncbi:MAG: hypothetical protein GY851_10220 [bacterium]|nr:hypothetical protein [bacterium]